ncbi:hypothetical protein OHT93_02070 [Streptomyces sp. NBC_00191]|uniref:hypothetical protein n=1 Tax=Streptomyces sp. NBC_00191 TaxID=2975674 RepID=UPI0032557E3D
MISFMLPPSSRAHGRGAAAPPGPPLIGPPRSRTGCDADAIVVERRYAPDPIDYERLVSLVESTGERVVLTEADVPVSVLLPAGVVAELEHWARADYPTPAPIPQDPEEDDASETTWDVGRLRVEPLTSPQEHRP